MGEVTPYTLVHIIVAGFCTLMALVHLAMWVAVRGERNNLHVATAFFGFALLIGGSSGGAEAAGGLGLRGPWALMAVSSALPLFSGLCLTAWSTLDAPLTRARRALLLVLLSVAAVHVAVAAVAVWRDPGLSFEVLVRELPTAKPIWVAVTVVVVLWLGEALLAVRARGRVALTLLVGALPAGGVVAREILLLAGQVEGTSYFAMSGLPFALFASVLAVVRYVRAAWPGQLVGEYRIVKKLAEGGMGELYLAERVGPAGFRRTVALKRMRSGADDALTERFLSEARLAARLHHPNIVAVYDLGKLDDGWFIAMELIAGVSLAELQKRALARGERLPPGLVAAIGEQVCHALAHAHERGIVHRDIKPQNVMVAFDGTVKIVDFGIARHLPGAETPNVLPSGKSTLTGTPGYIAPEVLAGEATTSLSDLYSLGVVMFELIAGRRPGSFASSPLPAAAADALLSLCPDAGRLLCEAVASAIAHESSDRPASAAELAKRLRAARMGLTSPDPGELAARLFPLEAEAARPFTADAMTELTTQTAVRPLRSPGVPSSEEHLPPTRPLRPGAGNKE